MMKVWMNTMAMFLLGLLFPLAALGIMRPLSPVMPTAVLSICGYDAPSAIIAKASALHGSESGAQSVSSLVPLGGIAAAKSAEQLEFGFVKNLESPNNVIFKNSHLEANPGLLRPGEYKLYLPNLGNAELNWAQNQQALQKAMNIGKPIRDLSPNCDGGFLQKERDFLLQGRWKFDSGTGYWNPPTH